MITSNWNQASRSPFFDAAAFPTYDRLLHRYLTRRLRLPQDVEDIAHDIYIRLLQYQPAAVSYPLAYLYGVASHVLADYRAHAAREGAALLVDSEVADEAAKAVNTTGDACADQVSTRQQLTRALSSLPPTHAAVLMTQTQHGLSYGEVAETLGLSVHTVKKYVAQARATLRSARQD